jgi:hypothetical protein
MKKRTLPRLALTRLTMRPLDAEPRVLAAIRGASARGGSHCDPMCVETLAADGPQLPA